MSLTFLTDSTHHSIHSFPSYFFCFWWYILNWHLLWAAQVYFALFNCAAKGWEQNGSPCRAKLQQTHLDCLHSFFMFKQTWFFIMKLSFLLPIFDFYVHLCTCLNSTHLLLCKYRLCKFCFEIRWAEQMPISAQIVFRKKQIEQTSIIVKISNGPKDWCFFSHRQKCLRVFYFYKGKSKVIW